MVVKVKQKDIANGERGVCERCPLALALRRCFPGANVKVSREHIIVDGDYYEVSNAAMRFIDAFDYHGKKSVRPSQFRIEGLERPADA